MIKTLFQSEFFKIPEVEFEEFDKKFQADVYSN